MANVQVFQRHAHLAAAVRIELVNGREGKVAKAVLTAISNTRRGAGVAKDGEATAIQWTLWGRQAEHAAAYLDKGSHVNIVGRVRNNNYCNSDGATAYGLVFTAEEIDYLDSRVDAEARRISMSTDTTGAARSASASTGEGRPRKARNERPSALTSA